MRSLQPRVIILKSKQALVDFIKFDARDEPYIEAIRCSGCAAVYFEARQACARCFARTGFETYRPASSGVLYTYTIVYRSFPGAPTPFIHAVVDIDGGGVLRGTLQGVPAEPEQIAMGMAVDIVIEDVGRALGQVTGVLGYFFRPASGERT
jgi:hypothetical protein